MFGIENFTRVKRCLARWASNESGSAFLFVMMLISVLAILGGAITNTMTFESRDAYRQLQRTQAFYMAEAGIQRAGSEQAPGTYTRFWGTAGYTVQAVDWGADGTDNDGDGMTDEGDEADHFKLISTGTAGGESRKVEAIAQGATGPQELFYHHAIYAGNTSGLPYTLQIGGTGADADAIQGDAYANGDVNVSGTATVTVPESYTDANSNGEWDTGEAYTDSNSDGYYNFGVEATGTITGVAGVTGGNLPINPPRIWDMNYEQIADVNVANEFSNPANLVVKSNTGIEPGMNSSVTTVISANPASIFAKGVLPDYGPVDDLGPTTNQNYFFGDWHNLVSNKRNGEKITVASSWNNKLYFVDGNLWIETNGYGPTLYSQSSTVGTRLTIVVKGNIYIADKLLYQNKALDGILLIAMNDGETYSDRGNGQYNDGELYEDLNNNGTWNTGEPYTDAPDWRYTPGVDQLHDYGMDGIPNTGDAGEGNGTYDGNVENSGNIFLGDPNIGPLGEIDAFLYAQNDFMDYVLNDSNGNPENFVIFGNMSAGNQVNIHRDRQITVVTKPWRRKWKGSTISYTVSKHTKMTVNFDNRLRAGTLGLPFLPRGGNRIFEGQGWGVLSWHR